MEDIENNNPQLINCLGTLNTKMDKCNECKYAFYCILTQRELKDDVFARFKDRGKSKNPKELRLK